MFHFRPQHTMINSSLEAHNIYVLYLLQVAGAIYFLSSYFKLRDQIKELCKANVGILLETCFPFPQDFTQR